MKGDSMSTPIADLEKEKFVLSAMLIRDGECVPEVVAALNANDFYRPVHRIVFRTIAKLYSEGTPPNALSIISELERTNELGDDKQNTQTLTLTFPATFATLKRNLICALQRKSPRKLPAT